MDPLFLEMNNRLVAISTKQEAMADDLAEVKRAVMGSGDEPGIRMEVDRLKRSEATRLKLLWLALTAGASALAERTYHWITSKT